MSPSDDVRARILLLQEARARLTRIERLSPFALRMPMVSAATVSPAAQTGVETLRMRGRRALASNVRGYLAWMKRTRPRAAHAQRRFNILRLRFNTIIRHFDVFASVLGQRSEHETGVWVAGLDDVAADALALPGNYFVPPPIICYLDRNHGAAIRRAYTRLPGGAANPVAVISIPRERMIGSGIASSLVHEVGHQGAALLEIAAPRSSGRSATTSTRSTCARTNSSASPSPASSTTTHGVVGSSSPAGSSCAPRNSSTSAARAARATQLVKHTRTHARSAMRHLARCTRHDPSSII